MHFRQYIKMSIVILILSCKDDEFSYASLIEENEQYGGGIATTFDQSENAFGQLSTELISRNSEFVVGNSFFRRNWVTEPSSTVDLDGLGPLFNARSCGACHFKDGRAAPPITREEKPLGLLFRLGRPSAIEWVQLPDNSYGNQFQPNALFGLKSEGDVIVDYIEQNGEYPDGSTYSLRKPIYTFENLNYGGMQGDTKASPRIAPQMIGLGMLEAIPEASILALVDESDSDGDGISGRANYVNEKESNQLVLGRFGWKANEPSIRQQVAGAFRGDIGITSSIFPNEVCTSAQQDCYDFNYQDDIELTDRILDRVTFYSRALSVPIRRDWDSEVVLKGKMLFNNIQCKSCHIPKFETGVFDPIPEYGNQVIRPYTDLLLHDMGDGLADNIGDHRANGKEWKTPPLWGLGMLPVVNNHTFLLHDGRARNFEEAILWHGGEAENSKNEFMHLDKSSRDAIISFLESL